MPYEVAIGWDNRLDTALITATNQIATLPAAHLQTTDIQQIWRASANTASLIADFGSQILWGGTALVQSNALPTDIVRIGLSLTDSSGLARDAYDSGEILSGIDPNYGILVHFPLAQVTGRYLRIDLAQSSLPEAGRWFAGPVWRPSRAFSYGWRPLWRDPSRRTQTLGQFEVIDRKFRQRGFGFTLTGITEAEANDQVWELNRVNGNSRDVLVCRDVQSTRLGRDTIWGLLENPAGARQDHPDFYTVDFEHYARL